MLSQPRLGVQEKTSITYWEDGVWKILAFISQGGSNEKRTHQCTLIMSRSRGYHLSYWLVAECQEGYLIYYDPVRDRPKNTEGR